MCVAPLAVMRWFKLLLAAIAATLFVHCASETTTGSQGAALCTAEWSPTWREGTGANEWWVEYTIGGGAVASAYLEIPGVRNVTLMPEWGKWGGSSPRIPQGTQVILHAQNTAGQNAQTLPFGYRDVQTPATDPCTPVGSDGGTGACDDAYQPTFEEGSGAGEWWVEYEISGNVRSAFLGVGGATVTLAPAWGKWRGKPPARIPTGTSVFLHVENTSGQIAESTSFRYLVDTPVVKPCDSGGGTCSGLNPTWSEGSGANEWWVEYKISGSLRTASLSVSGGRTVTLSLAGTKWSGKPTARIPAGTTVVLRAESTSGETAETNPFRYLVDMFPVTKSCGTANPDSGLDFRPSNTTCLAPPRPTSTTGVGLSQVYADLFASTTPNRVTSPMLMVQRPGDGSRWFLAQRDGRIVSFNASGSRDLRQVLSAAQLRTLTGKSISLVEEGAFYSMAFDPSFSTNGRLYISFSTTGDSTTYAHEIGYLTSTDNGTTFTRYTRLLHMGRARAFHYGGTVLVGKDGYLYVTSGDGADDSKPQYKDNFWGKVLRIDVHGTAAPGKPYGIPPSNPFAGGGGLPEIFAWGVRNPFRMTVDRLTGDLWLGDVGEDSYEEVNRIQLGQNYGWPCREGAHEGGSWTNTFRCPSHAGLVDPIAEHAHAGTGASVTGGFVYRGSELAGFQGTYVYGDFIRKQLRGLRMESGVWTSTILNASGPADGYTSFAEDAAGELYAMSLFDQKIHKVVAGSTQVPSTFPQRLSETGCVVAGDPTRPAPGMIPYAVNAELWSDGATKDRWLALPNGTRITVGADGDFDLPIRSVLMKTFSLAGRRVETRLFVRHTDGDWAGYSYEWNAAGTDALLLPSSKTTSSWTFPSRNDCLVCHTTGAGRSLGLEIGQLNGTLFYPQTQRTANQLTTLAHIGLFTTAIGDPATLASYPKPFDGAPSEAKARSYLHANCGGCHRPNGGAARSTMDWRFSTPLASTNSCNATPILDDFGNTATRLIKPGSSTESIVSLRMHSLDARRMPPLASSRVHPEGTALIDAWIGGLEGCP
jgi:uncharacterized repeat protein (TIGR03806 family)